MKYSWRLYNSIDVELDVDDHNFEVAMGGCEVQFNASGFDALKVIVCPEHLQMFWKDGDDDIPISEFSFDDLPFGHFVVKNSVFSDTDVVIHVARFRDMDLVVSMKVEIT